MAKSAQDRRDHLLEQNQKKIDAVQAKIDKQANEEGRAEKIAAAEKTLANAQARLARLQNGDNALETQKQALLAERDWINSMPVAAAPAAVEDPAFEDDDDENAL